MISGMLAAITNWIIHIISSLGYPGVGLLMGIQSAAIPLPSEVIIPFAGFLAQQGRFSILGLAFAGGLGSMVGSWVTYFLGFYGGRPLVLRYGRYILISEQDLNLTERFFQKFGVTSILIGQVLPIVRTFISIPAGLAKLPFFRFSISVFIGSFIWSYVLAEIGSKLGEHWSVLQVYFHKFDIVIVGLIVVLVGVWIYRHIKRV